MLAPNSLLQDRYVIERVLGHGGAGMVYVAYDQHLFRRCAIKEALRSNEASFQKALKREALFLAKLQHRALPHVFDHFTENGLWYVAMQLIPGDDLANQLKRNQISFGINKVLEWADEVLDALTHLHKEGIVHGDIKPANLKVSPSGQIFLLDFGFASGVLPEISDFPSSVAGHTPAYAAPEQIDGLKPEPPDDLYSLGATLYHLLLYDSLPPPLPFTASVRNAAIANGKPDPLQLAHEVNPQISPNVAKILSQALSRCRNDRQQSAAEMRAQLREARIISSSLGALSHISSNEAQLQPTELYYQFETVVLDKEGKTVKSREAEAKYFIDELGVGTTIEMVAIRGGNFVMGSPEWQTQWANRGGPVGSAGPEHGVAVPSFYIGKYQITQSQWRAVAAMKKISCELDPNPSKFPFPPMTFEGHELPVEDISWEHAVEFCARLSAFTAHHYRLPTEAEWEYTCRSGTTTPFTFGATLTPKVANFGGHLFHRDMVTAMTHGSTIPVGLLGVANGFGIYDMPGNVWEWCADRYHQSYEGAPSDGSAWQEGDRMSHVIRGGCWDSPLELCASASRLFGFSFATRGIGLRVACET